MNGPLPQLYTIGEVAKYLRMSRSQVYTLIAKKQLPSIRLSERRIVVSEDDLASYIQKHKARDPGPIVLKFDRISEE